MEGFFHRVSDGISSAVSRIAGGGGAARTFVVDETPSHSGSDDEDNESQSDSCDTSHRKIQFKNVGGILKSLKGISSAEQYLEAVMNWSSKPFVDRQPFDKKRETSKTTNISKILQHVSIGEYTIAEVTQLVQDAADVAGFCIYEHKGHNEHKGLYNNRCTLKFGCECGRKRYAAKEKDRQPKEFVVDLDGVVVTNCRKRKSTRKNYGNMPAFTNHRRLKNSECPFQFSLVAYQNAAKFDEMAKANWQLSSHLRAKHCFEHRGHTMRTMGRSKLSTSAKQYILDNCEQVSIPQLVDEIQRMFTIDTDRDAVRWVVRAQNKTAAQGRAPVRGQAGAAADSIRDLLKTNTCVVVLLLRECSTGKWFSSLPTLVSGQVHYSLEPYTDFEMNPRNASECTPLRNCDPDRVIRIHGDEFFVHTQAWNYASETKLFEAYPHVVQMDCQANVNNSTDGFNCVAVDGNYHNIIILRAFVGSQKAEMFRWILRIAIPALVPNYQKIQIFICDGCDALLGELRACCIPGGVFPVAKILLCIFHLLIKNYDDKFGYALRRQTPAPWFQFFKNALMTVRNCESVAELTECKNYVLRVAAGWQDDDFPKTDTIKFLMARLKKCEEWVLCYHVSTCTRGCSATPRCEGEHGHSRNAGVNARCSWPVTINKYGKTLTRRRRLLMKWADKQISRSLGRSVTNAHESTLTDAILTHLDSVALPWMVDTMEVQMLLGKKESLRCIYTAETVNASTFAVFFEDAELEDDHGAAPDVANPDGEPEVPGSPQDTSSDERDESEDETASAKRQNLREDSDLVDEDEWTEQMQTELDYVLANPLKSNTTFFYRKIRTLTLKRDPKNGTYLQIICDCGYAPRIGCACRHVWCFLFTILKAIPRSLGGLGSVIQLCECLTSPNSCGNCKAVETYRPFSWEDFPQFNFEHMMNMDVASKVKYHAVLRPDVNANSLFPEVHSTPFHPRISAYLFHQFTRTNRPEGVSRVPTAGIPENCSSDEDEQDNDVGSYDAPNPNPSEAPRRSSRTAVPTLAMVSNLTESIWDRINRLKDKKSKVEAKSLLWTNLQDTLEQIDALQPVLLPKKLTRYYSLRDRVIGMANHMESR
jgi:hypothetical protein